MSVCVYAHVCVCMHVHARICVCMCMHACVCMPAHVCACIIYMICVCTHIMCVSGGTNVSQHVCDGQKITLAVHHHLCNSVSYRWALHTPSLLVHEFLRILLSLPQHLASRTL